jgi:septal ring factor EnvC (AmiA/AmiB activator)
MHRSPRARKTLLLPLVSCLVLALSAPVALAAEATVKYTRESIQEYEKQLASGQIQSATFNKRVRSVHLTLKDGRHMLIKYAAHGEPALAAQLAAKGVPVTVKKPAEAAKEAKKPVKHKLRYIAGGILIVVIVVVGGVLLFDRRRKATME